MKKQLPPQGEKMSIQIKSVESPQPGVAGGGNKNCLNLDFYD
jgi:hypothetical protein